MARVPPYFTWFQRLRDLADVIIVDQRGLGRSAPVLDCPFAASLPDSLFLVPGQLVAAFRSQVAACAERWRAQGSEPTAYSTVESADDVDDLRGALGIPRIDVVAFSYGTRLALAVLQRHEPHVRRLVLQGVNGPGLVIKRPVAVTRKLELLGHLLAQDSLWPNPTDLVAAARAARDRLARGPTTITILDRRTGDSLSLPVGVYGFDAIAALSLDDPRLPALLVSVSAGDDRLLGRMAEAVWNGLATGTVGLMARAVNCSADRPEPRWRASIDDAATVPLGAPVDNEFLTDAFCRAAGFDTSPIEFPQPVRSSRPALLLTGTLDATNPSENARAVAIGLTRATLLDVHNAPHEALTVPAVQDAIVAFLEGQAVSSLHLEAEPPRFPTLQAALSPAQPNR